MKKLLLGLTTITLALFSCSTFQKTIPYQDSLQGRIRQHLIKTGEKETGKMYTDSSYEYRYKTLIDSNNVVLVATMLDQDVWQEDYRAEVLRRKKHKLNPNIVVCLIIYPIINQARILMMLWT